MHVHSLSYLYCVLSHVTVSGHMGPAIDTDRRALSRRTQTMNKDTCNNRTSACSNCMLFWSFFSVCIRI